MTTPDFSLSRNPQVREVERQRTPDAPADQYQPPKEWTRLARAHRHELTAPTLTGWRADFWRSAFGTRAQAVRWWVDLMKAFGASLPEASAWAHDWADRYGYRSRKSRQ